MEGRMDKMRTLAQCLSNKGERIGEKERKESTDQRKQERGHTQDGWFIDTQTNESHPCRPFVLLFFVSSYVSSSSPCLPALSVCLPACLPYGLLV
mmetsp:Transcript_35359/g.69792  ORF Transcript_35359/g.69792 Transcript_35359/m.69792 type:complete len:95 (+) Transcript_35359:2076-2360(+)